MSQPLPPREPVRPAVLSLARRVAALKDAARRLRRWPRGRARPSLTAAARVAFWCSGRDEKTALQPNQKTGLAVEGRRTTHALQKADIFTRHRQVRSRSRCLGPVNGGTRKPGFLHMQFPSTYGIDWDKIERDTVVRAEQEKAKAQEFAAKMHAAFGMTFGTSAVPIEKVANPVDLPSSDRPQEPAAPESNQEAPAPTSDDLAHL